MTTQAEDGTEFQECLLRCHSAQREGKERTITERLKERFEKAVSKLHDGLSKKGTHKKLEAVNRCIGRLQKQHARVASHYDINVVADDKGEKAIAVNWSLNVKPGTMMAEPGVYCLRSNVLEWDAETMWRVLHLSL